MRQEVNEDKTAALLAPNELFFLVLDRFLTSIF